MSEVTTYDAGGKSPEATAELVERAQSGDQNAMEELLASHQDFAFRTAMRFCSGNEEAAFELAQEALVNAYRKLDKFKGNSRFSTWLYRIVTNLAKNRYVRQNRERARYFSYDTPQTNDPENDSPREFDDPSEDPRLQAQRNEALARLDDAVANLDDEFREVFLLRFHECMSYEQIAEAAEIPVGTVKSRINRARKTLKDELGDLLAEIE